ncbi:hypothetical protein ACRBU7_14440 [Priestia aryabhattai]|uniref:hypothetical protein n=1 Tax=Priestia aryabhattai TaxID=412384 RepID=UPI003D7F906B
MTKKALNPFQGKNFAKLLKEDENISDEERKFIRHVKGPFKVKDENEHKINFNLNFGDDHYNLSVKLTKEEADYYMEKITGREYVPEEIEDALNTNRIKALLVAYFTDQCRITRLRLLGN